MRHGIRRLSVSTMVMAGVLAATIVAAPGVSAAPERGLRVDIRPVSLTVDGETATGRVYEPYRSTPGDLNPGSLVVAVHGHAGSAADFPDYLSSIVRRTGTPLLTMDQRSAESRWRTGDWNVWAGWRDTVTATRWYRDEHPDIRRTVLWGWSQGGLTSGLAAAYAPPGTYDYWVSTFGQADDFSSWLEGPLAAPDLRAQIERDAGDCAPWACPGAYIARSPALLAARITVRRTILLHGTADTLVPFTSSVEMRAALVAAGKSVSLYTVISGRDLDGTVAPAGHGVGPVFFESGCVVERLLLEDEPRNSDYLIDVANNINTAPDAPAGAKCAA
ncbi:prolyl oligopeptidase family serine peptidase [Nocardia sp. NPDC005978]|uniref:alpha/beta hydrolase family protein n=1 Tax=Nocardia sp. NPDC005978 TaxID=3156725 RepID=UPI0033A800F9